MGESGHSFEATFSTYGTRHECFARDASIEHSQTSLASRAVDAFGDEETRKQVQAQLLKYLETDTIWLVTLPTLVYQYLVPEAFTLRNQCRSSNFKKRTGTLS